MPPREKLWRTDYDLTLKYGVRQPYAENSGPGGFAHALRNIRPVLEIAHDMEQACPDAWFVNYSNPMIRICDAITRYSKIKVVGLCHQIHAGYGMVGYVLGGRVGHHGAGRRDQHPRRPRSLAASGAASSHQAMERVDIKAAGLNHFTWMLDLRDKQTRRRPLPALCANAWPNADPTSSRSRAASIDAFGRLPIPGDEHLCEYLPWLSDPPTKPWEKYDVSLYDWDRRRQRASTATATSPAWARTNSASTAYAAPTAKVHWR